MGIEKNIYVCGSCNKEFTYRSMGGESPTCPYCASPNVKIKVWLHEVETQNQIEREARIEITTGPTIHHAMRKGMEVIVSVIMLVIAGYFAVALVPDMLTSITRSALTKVDPAMLTLFRTLLPWTIILILGVIFLEIFKREVLGEKDEDND